MYVGGEVKRPGYYTLAGHKNISAETIKKDIYQQSGQIKNSKEFLSIQIKRYNSTYTILDAVQAAQA